MSRKKAEAAPLPPIGPKPLPRFVQSPAFSAKWDRLRMTHDDGIALERAIVEVWDDPSSRTDVGNLRKIRFASENSGRGKRDAYRVCYALFAGHGLVYLVTLYGKGEKSDLTPTEKKVIGEIIGELEAFLGKGEH